MNVPARISGRPAARSAEESGAGSWKISSAREPPPPRKAKAAARRRRRCSAGAAASPAKPTRLPRSCRSARLRWMRPIGTRSSTSAAAWFCGCGGANAGERSRSRHLAFDRPGRHAQVVRRARRAGSQPARRGSRLGRLAHIYKPPAHDDEDSRLRAGRLLDPGRRLEQGRFALPAGPRGASVALSRTDLQALLDGIDFAAIRRRKRYARPRVAAPGNSSNIS